MYKITGAHGYDPEWKKRLEAFMAECPLPAFVQFLPKGYVTKYIDGVDLWGDKPFERGSTNFALSDVQRQNILSLVERAVSASVKTGVYLGDITRRNIILKGDIPYLIDYDHMYEGQASRSHYREIMDFLNCEL